MAFCGDEWVMEFKSTVEEVHTWRAFARSVPMARPNRMVVEVNDGDGQFS